MNIPESVLEPFGYTGIPTLRINPKVIRYEICDAVWKYGRIMGEMKPWYHHHNVIREVRHLARMKGAINIRCKLYSSNADRRIFELEFDVPHLDGRVTFGFPFG